ncbi:36634_t:CDS:1, partial [Gigaspora margarita]
FVIGAVLLLSLESSSIPVLGKANSNYTFKYCSEMSMNVNQSQKKGIKRKG